MSDRFLSLLGQFTCQWQNAIKAVGTRLSYRISLAASMLTMAFILAVGGTSYYIMRAQITACIETALHYEAILQAAHVSDQLRAVISTMTSLSQNTLVLNSLMDSFTRETSLIPFLQDFGKINGVPVAIALTDFQGNTVAASAKVSPPPGNWQRQVLEKGNSYAKIVTKDARQFLFIAEPVFYSRTPSPEGALIYEVPLENLLVEDLGKDPLHQDVLLLYRDNFSLKIANSGTSQPAKAAGSPKDPMTKTTLLNIADFLEPLQFTVTVTANRSLLEAALQPLFYNYLVIGILLILVVLSLSITAGYYITRPLRELEGVATAVIASGSFNHRVAVKGKDEIARLTAAFNQMLDKLQTAYEGLEAKASALLESEQRYRRIFQTATVAILEKDISALTSAIATCKQSGIADWRAYLDENPQFLQQAAAMIHVVDVNQAAIQMFEAHTKQELLKSLDNVLAPESYPVFREQLLAIAENQPTFSTEAMTRTLPGNRLNILLSLHIPSESSSANDFMLVSMMDITELKQAEQALRERAGELARSNAELEQFAAVASHDLQEPLRKVQAFGERLQSKYGAVLAEDGRDYLARMQNAARRMQILINDLLTFSRVSTRGQPYRSVALTEVVRQVISDMEASLEASQGYIELEPLPHIDADALQMRQLFQNLIGNALKYRHPEKPPCVQIWGRILEKNAISPGVSAVTGKACMIWVEDNGIGFEQKYAERIFGIFQRLHSRTAYEGTGIGLALCRKIVERHHGQIVAHSTLGAGTTITLTLPLTQNKQGSQS